jgi:site-specific DNA recombinase
VRPARHSADIPKKGRSVVRTEPGEWTEIPVPAIVSEALFLAVQEQLEENRKHARRRRRGAAYLLQGLTVCGQCHYAYYGKKVSKTAAKGGQQYAYYRCIGTDAYRFGGERICDNKQVRTQRLDELVWEQVVELLSHPDRLKQEYERRLDALERKETGSEDTEALERQRRNLEKAKSRLIDSYTDGVIDKVDFEPRIAQLKVKLQQIDHQIAESKRHQTGQLELFLVINRLEEFAAAVNDRLNAVDFNTKREIIRALVKRIEIHKEEIVVVFRVEPQSGPTPGDATSAGDRSADTQTKRPSMQDCNRRYRSPLRRALLAIADDVSFDNPCVQPFAYQAHQSTIIDSLLHDLSKLTFVNVVEKSTDVCVYQPVDAVLHAALPDLFQRLVGAVSRSKSV